MILLKMMIDLVMWNPIIVIKRIEFLFLVFIFLFGDDVSRHLKADSPALL